MKTRLTILCFLITLSTFLFAQPAINSFTPTSGPVGTSVTITGTGFSTTASSNVVFFGSVKASVASASTTQLMVTVPAGATYKRISVTNTSTGLTAYSAKPFSLTFNCGGEITSSSFIESTSCTTGTSPLSVAVGDLNNDGLSDIAVANSAATSISVFKNTSTTGNISFAAKSDFTTSMYATDVAIEDLNGDGKKDIVVINGLKISVFKNTSSGGSISFAARVDYSPQFISEMRGLSIADLDSDGKPEICFVDFDGSQSAVGYLKNTSTTGAISFTTPAYTSYFRVCKGSYGLTIADFNGDKKQDIATVSNTVDSISVLKNTSTVGTISFSSYVNFTCPCTAPLYIAACDINGDDKPDLVTPSNSSNSAVCMNTSTSTTISFTNNGGGPRGFISKFENFNGDNKPDMYYVFGSSNYALNVKSNISTSSSILWNSGAQWWYYSQQIKSVDAGDFDNDGRTDIVAGNLTNNKILIFRNMLHEIPALTTPQIDSICNNSTTEISLSGSMSSTFSWSALDNANVSGESTGVQSTNEINDSLINNTQYLQEVKYIVIPTSTEGCGSGAPDTISVFVKPYNKPASAGSIFGDTLLCSGQTETFSITPVANVNSYEWYLPAGASGNSNSTSIDVSFGDFAQTGIISVITSNECGVGGISSLNIKVSKIFDIGESQISKNNLEVYFPFYENANDQSGNSRNGIIHGATLTSDRFGNPNSAYYFDGVNDFISASNMPTNYNAYTMSCWVLPSDTSPGKAILDQAGMSGATNVDAFGLYISSASKYYGRHRKSDGSLIFAASSAVISTDWSHLLLTWDEAMLKYYCNGILIASTSANSITTVNDSLHIGSISINHNHDYFFKGKIDDIAVYSRAFSESEIDQIYNGNTLIVSLLADSICNQPSEIQIANSQSGITYQILDNGTPSGNSVTGNGGTISLSSGIMHTGDDITIRATDDNTGCYIVLDTVLSPVILTQGTPIITLIGSTLLSNYPNGNQWYNQNGSILGATSQDYTPTEDGSYYVIVTNYGCVSDSSNVIHVTLTGIIKMETDEFIKVYPNPVTNELIIDAVGIAAKSNFEILNSIGQVVFKGNLVDKTTVQTSNFAPGVYLIKLENGKTFEFKKIIKE